MNFFRILLLAGAVLLSVTLLVSAAALRASHNRISLLNSQRSTAQTRHGQIEYESWGTGPVVLVVHGAAGGFDQGRLLAEAVGGEGFRWIAVSRFGYLGSAMPGTPTTAAQAEAFVDLLDALNVEQVSVLAMSGGVPPSLKLAEMFPERVDRMMLLSSAPFTPFAPDVEDRPVPTWVYSALLGNDIVYWALTRVARNQLKDAFDARAELREGIAENEQQFVEDLIDTFLPASRRLAGVNNEGAAVDPATAYALEDIRASVLVVHARDDRLNPFAVGEAIQGRIAASRLLAFERGGHLLLGHHAELRREFQILLAE